MSSIGDSSAVLESEKILSQHQAAITLLSSLLQNPQIDKFYWLDLACGKGQIISQINENLTIENRRKIIYHGYDINVDYLKIVKKIANMMDFMNSDVHTGDLSVFADILPKDILYDFITCTNVSHEIHPQKFLRILIGALKKLNKDGQLYLYDMESLSNPELGAIPLKANEIKGLIEVIFKTTGSDFKVSASTWSHRTCKGWSILINRKYLGIENEEIEKCNDTIIRNLHTEIKTMLSKKLDDCKQVLESYTRYGSETGEDERQKISALYEFWALNRALEELL